MYISSVTIVTTHTSSFHCNYQPYADHVLVDIEHQLIDQQVCLSLFLNYHTVLSTSLTPM